MSGALVELRVLDGANLYFTRATIKLTLDVGLLVDAPAADAKAYAAALGLGSTRPGRARSGFRQRFVARLVAQTVRRVAREAGIARLGVRVRPQSDVHRLVVAFPWVHIDRAKVFGRGIAELIEAFGTSDDLSAAVADVATRVRSTPAGDPPPTIRPRIPVVAVTGTNGKTTTSRMVAHIGRTAGLRVGWSSTDGIYVDGELIEAGDYSGPSGAGTVLAQPGVQLAVTETARGGILRRGIGVTHNDVSVVTNISADHLGLGGIETVDQLAEVKAVVTRITRARGWCVVNGDDPRAFAMRLGSPAKCWVFSRDPESPSVRTVLAETGRATTVIDGWITVLRAEDDPLPLLKVADVPMTLVGLSRFNVENALAAASAALALNLPDPAVIDGLRSFAPGPDLNPGRMNIYSLGDTTVVVDLAHNEAGLDALLEVMAGLRAPGGKLRLVLGVPGDRPADAVTAMGATGAQGTDQIVIAHKSRYQRGRHPEETDTLFRAGADSVGVPEVPAYDDELPATEALLATAGPRDVVAVMCIQEPATMDTWLHSQGATVDAPTTLRQKVDRAHP